MAKKPELDRTIVAQNRKARHNYFIEETMEAGLALTGTEVKSLRGGRSSIAEAYITDLLRNAGDDDFQKVLPAGAFEARRKAPRNQS